MEKCKDRLGIVANVKLQLAILLILAIFDVIMTMIGMNIGLHEKNPLWMRLGEDMYLFRVVTIALFVGFFGLAGQYPESTLYRACKKALIVGIIIIGLVVALNTLQILWAAKESYSVVGLADNIFYLGWN